MVIQNILINVSDVARSADFYTHLLGGRLVGEATTDSAVVDFVTATIQLRLVGSPAPCTWREDDQYLGFRHVGFKVADVDPDGTVLEMVQGQLQYHDVVDLAGVAAGRAMATPSRPRFDHLGVTIRDLKCTAEVYRPLGFGNIGTLFFPDDPRGFRIDYLKGGDSVLEVFTLDVEVFPVPPVADALGFLAVELESLPQLAAVGAVAGRAVFADANDFTFTVGR